MQALWSRLISRWYGKTIPFPLVILPGRDGHGPPGIIGSPRLFDKSGDRALAEAALGARRTPVRA